MSVEAAHPVFEQEAVRRRQAVHMLPALAAFAPVLGLAAAQGGYFPSSWGWASVPLLWSVAIALIVGNRVPLNSGERALLVALAALAGWIALSSAWSVVDDQSVLELERALVYVAVVSAVLVLSRGGSTGQVLGGLLAAVSLIATFSLLTRVVPDRIGVYDRNAVYRLSQPIGYWNGLGIFAGMGALIAIGFAVRARTVAVRAMCAAVLVVLLPTLYFTFGRAAWIALAAGLAVAVAVDPRRLQLLAAVLVLGPLPAAAVLAASKQSGLTHAGAPLARAAHDGHRLALILLLLMAANALLAVAFAYISSRVDFGRSPRIAFGLAVAIALALALAGVFVRYGGPVTLVKSAYTSFKAPPPHLTSNLNRRLLSFSGNGRADLWRLAWNDAKSHPVLGAGAGAYERYFLAHQPADVSRVRDAHGLYIETLAELGPIGLALLIAVFVVPLVGLRRVRGHPLVPLAAGAYVAYLVHTGVDWDWELPAVTILALLCGASILLAARRSQPRRPVGPVHFAVAAVAVVTAGFAALALLGNSALSRSNSARGEGRVVRAANDARRARYLMPWSPRPWEALGLAQREAGAQQAARRSFRKAISMDDGDWRLWYDLASVSAGPAERRALRHAVELFPRSGLLASAGSSRGAQR